MRVQPKLLALTAAAALAVPGAAIAANGPSSNANAYGKYCQAESKKHADGEKSPFAICVNAMAKLDHGQASNPKEACKAESKKHVKGTKNTPFSLCVQGGRHLEEDAS
jgi:hypothetical protein